MSSKKMVQKQFGQNAQTYTKSQTHRLGRSLTRLVELVPTEPGWQVLDVAAAVGFTGFAFAPQVDHVWVTDITKEMLYLARQEAADRGLANITVEYADAEALPYADQRFDLVTCRIAAHHFANIEQFLSEAARVLRPGGVLAVVDNVVPEGPGGDYVNAFEKLRDPSHGRCLAIAAWLAAFAGAGLTMTHHETLEKTVNFEFWAKRHDQHTRQFLRTMLTHAPPEAADLLKPTTSAGQTIFHLQEGIFIGRKT